jgi:hypothetical protein
MTQSTRFQARDVFCAVNDSEKEGTMHPDYFEGVKVGDTVYYVGQPFTVKETTGDGFYVEGGRGMKAYWFVDMDGRVMHEEQQTFFWEPLKYYTPPRPKRW